MCNDPHYPKADMSISAEQSLRQACSASDPHRSSLELKLELVLVSELQRMLSDNGYGKNNHYDNGYEFDLGLLLFSARDNSN